MSLFLFFFLQFISKHGIRVFFSTQGLYEEPERPPNAVDYIKRYMGAPTQQADGNNAEVESLKTEVATLTKK